MHRCLAAAALFVYLALAAAANKPKDLPERYKTWLTRDAVYLITEDERKAFLGLDTDAARDEFIQSFWDIRNPLRGSKTNPFKEEHYRRIEYANAHFGRQSNTPGWMTDQGRAFILFGKPESQHTFTGYGQIYPLELWFYSNNSGNPSLPPFFYLLFYIPEYIGEYKFYRPGFDGPMKLVRGSQFNSNRDVYNFLKPLGGDVAHAAFSLLPNDPIDTVNFSPDMSGDMLVNKISNFANDTFNVRRIRELRAMSARVSSYFLVAQEKKLDVNVLALSDPLGHYWLDYAALIDDPKLGKPDMPARQLKLSLGYHLYTAAGELIAEDAEDRAWPAFESSSADARFLPFVVANRLPIEPGKYRLEVEVLNREAGKTFKGERQIEVGPSKQLSFSGPLLANSIDKVARPDSVTPFQYFGIQFHPAPNRRFDRRQPIRLLFELQAPAEAKGDWQIEYVIAHMRDREARQRLTDDAPAASFEAGRLLKSKTIPIADLEEGDYRLVINVRPAGASEVVASTNVALRIEEQAAEPPLYVSSLSRGLANAGVTAYIRGLEAAAQKNAAGAAVYMAQAVEENPRNSFASELLVEMYFNQRKFSSITGLYKKMGIDAFKAAPQTLAEISLSFWNTGDRAQAFDVIDAAKNYFPDNALLAETRSRYGGPQTK